MPPIRVQLENKKAKGDRGPVVLPEVVDGQERDWEIKEVSPAEAQVDYDKGLVEVPMASDEYSLATRAHELGHVAFTPADLLDRAGVLRRTVIKPSKPGMPADLVNAVEDGRVNARLKRLEIGTPDPNQIPGFDLMRLLHMVGSDPMFAACVRAASEGTELESQIKRQLARFWPMFAPGIEDQVARLSVEDATAQTTVEVSQAIFDLLLNPPPPEGEGEGEGEGEPGDGEGRPGKGKPGKDNKPQSKASLEDILKNAPAAARKPSRPKPKPYEHPKWDKWNSDNWQGFDLTKFFGSWKPRPPTNAETQRIEAEVYKYEEMMGDEGNLDIGGSSEGELVVDGIRSMIPHAISRHTGTAYWEKMDLDEPPRSIRVRSKGKGRGPRGEYYGRVVRYPQRMYTDRKVFKAKRGRTHYPGTILIDCSGSMALSIKQIQSVLEGYPAAEIRGYASRGHGYGEGVPRGLLRTFVRRGKRVHSKYLRLPGGGNGVDGVALRWLATQPRPRFWISDGQVTGLPAGGSGYSEAMTANLVLDSLEVMARGRIARFNAVEDFLEHFHLPMPDTYQEDEPNYDGSDFETDD
jgi:hypothetical protein